MKPIDADKLKEAITNYFHDCVLTEGFKMDIFMAKNGVLEIIKNQPEVKKDDKRRSCEADI